MKKFVIFTIVISFVTVFLSCKVEMPSKPPDWYYTLNIPLGDTTFYAMDFARTAKLDTVGDTLMVKKSKTITNIPYFLPDFGVDTLIEISFDVEDLDSSESFIDSTRCVRVTLGADMKGRIDETTEVALRFGMLGGDEWDTLLLEPTDCLDTTVCIYNEGVTLDFYNRFDIDFGFSISGEGHFDTITTFFEIPLHFLIGGARLHTRPVEIDIGDEIIKAVENHRLKEMICNIDIDNNTEIDSCTLSTDFYNSNYEDTVTLLEGYMLRYGYGNIKVKFSDEDVGIFSDSLVYYKVKLDLPSQLPDTIVISPHDFIKLSGYISATLFTDFKKKEK